MSTATAETPIVAAAKTVVLPSAQELWQRYHQQADTHIENALVEQYLPLVRSAVGRLNTEEEIIGPALSLLSPMSDVITGAILQVDHGGSIRI